MNVVTEKSQSGDAIALFLLSMNAGVDWSEGHART